MRYQRVRWLHDSPELPVLLYSEVDDDGWEVRKVDEYVNGHRDLASANIETGSTMLGEDRMPPLEEINDDPQFEGVQITDQEFEAVWAHAKAWFDLP
jgi:hypothetical protein